MAKRKEVSKEIHEIFKLDYPNKEQFKKLLSSLPESVLVKRYFLSGIPYIFKEYPLQYISFCESLSDKHKISPGNIIIIGSARMGYSLSPTKYGEELANCSDVDIVIISSEMFLRSVKIYANHLLGYTKELQKEDIKKLQSKQDYKEHKLYRIYNSYKTIGSGYISPHVLPDTCDFKSMLYETWNDASTQLLAMKPEGPVWKIRGRVFLDTYSAQRTYEDSLYRLKKDLRVTTDIICDDEDDDVEVDDK